MKVGSILKQNREIFSKKTTRPLKIIPPIIEEEEKIFQRHQILKTHDTFQQEINDKYTHKYVSTLYGLLFNNEKKYHIKRNKLNVKDPQTFKDESIPIIKSPAISLKKSRNSQVNHEKTLTPRKSFNSTYTCKGESGINKTHSRKINERNSCITSSQENSRWLDILHTTDKCFIEHRNSIKERELRRLSAFKEYYALPTPPIDINLNIKGVSPKRNPISNHDVNKNLSLILPQTKKHNLLRSQVIKMKPSMI